MHMRLSSTVRNNYAVRRGAEIVGTVTEIYAPGGSDPQMKPNRYYYDGKRRLRGIEDLPVIRSVIRYVST